VNGRLAVRAAFLAGWFLALLGIIAVVSLVPRAEAEATAPADVRCIAHRGGTAWTPGHTEQTDDTWDAALAAGVAEIEGDVRFTSTGYPYLLHDANLTLFGHGSVPISSVSGTTATGPTYVSASGDKLMSLYSARQKLVANPGVAAQFELKVEPTEDQWDMLANRLGPIKERTTITSFNRATIQEAQVRGYRTGLLSSTFSDTTEAPIFAINFNALEPDDVDIHSRVGVATQTWTIDTVAQWDDAAAAGVTAIITNDPAGCMAWSATP
jgi:glycerophosphoryl diester phosphodiesterase